MDLPKNRLKSALAEGRTQIGIWLGLAHSGVAEMASGAGFDWCLVDAEHGPNDVAEISTQLTAIERGGTEAVVRVPSNDPVWIKRVMDAGARSILVPMVNTAEEARAAAAACRYPPDGIRGVGASQTRASGYGAVADYTVRANAEVCVIVQAESAEAAHNIGEIAAVTGVDAVFIGPADLAASLGHTGNAGHQDVQAEIRRIAREIVTARKALGLITFDTAGIASILQLGATFVAVAGDAALLAEAMRTRAAFARSLLNAER